MNMNKMRWMRGSTFTVSLTTGLSSASAITGLTGMTGFSVSPFRSFHAAMAQFLYADGSVHTVTENIDASVYVGLSSIAGKEVIEQIDQ